MGRSSKTRAFMLVLLVVLFLVAVLNSEAWMTPVPNMPKKTGRGLILRKFKLGYKVDSQLGKNRGGRSLEGAGLERVSPGGPDPQHH